MPVCAQCGYDNAADARFCSQCGTPLAPGAQPGLGAPQQPPGGVRQDTSILSQITDTSGAGITGGGLGRAEGERHERTGDIEAVEHLSDEDEAAVRALPAGSALLIVQRGPNAGSRFLLDTDVVTAGRHPDSDIFLDDVTVSRRHAEFRRGSGGITVADVGSLNGTYINRDRIDQFALSSGDEVQIGKYRLVYFASAQGFDA